MVQNHGSHRHEALTESLTESLIEPLATCAWNTLHYDQPRQTVHHGTNREMTIQSLQPSQWQRIRPILDRALALEGSERERFLEDVFQGESAESPELRGHVEALVRAYDSNSLALETPAPSLDEPTPETVGPFRIERRIGAGGMGEVYLAERTDDYEQRVAVKLLRGGWNEALLTRFRIERQILARMEHPYIGRLLDGGSTAEGRPYLVMEYVEGETLDRYAAKLDVDGILRLFAKICSALAYAHRNLVVHRDLKPSNILVTADGTPKILDFGIAKILQPDEFPGDVQATATGASAMTPTYASPEQVQGAAVTTATDVYSLGVMLYELLAKARPYDFDPRDLLALTVAICHREPERPSTVAPPDRKRRLAGDLDAIVLQTLHKEPEQRYASAAQLEDDLRRHLSGHPVEARRNTAFYTFGKFVARHRLAVASAATALVLLLAFVGALLHQRVKILEERDRTLLERNRATMVSSWMTELFELPTPDRSLGERVSARELLDRGAASIETEVDDPALKAELMATMGRTYDQLGLMQEGRPLLQGAITLARSGSADVQALPRFLRYYADLEASDENFRAAETAAREATSRLEEASTPAPIEWVRLQNLLVDAQCGQGRYEDAAAVADRAVTRAKDLGNDEIVAEALESSAIARGGMGQLDGAATHFQEALDIRRRLHGEIHPDVARLLGHLAHVETRRDPELAEDLYRQALAAQEQLYGAVHPVVAIAINNLGLLYTEQGRYEEAEAELLRSLDMKRELFDRETVGMAITMSNLAVVHGKQGKKDAAERELYQALDILVREGGPDHPQIALTLNNLAESIQFEDPEEAETLLLRALDLSIRPTGQPDFRSASILASLGNVYGLQGRLDDSVARFEESVRLAWSTLGRYHPILPSAILRLSRAYDNQGDRAAAIRVLEENRAVWYDSTELTREAVMSQTQLAELLRRADRASEAVEMARDAVERWQELGESPADGWFRACRRIHIAALMDVGRYEDAEALALAFLDEPPQGDGQHQIVSERLDEIYEKTGRSDPASR